MWRKVGAGDRPGAFRIGYQGTNPKLVAEVANELASLFIEENLRTRERQAQGTADFIDSQLQAAKKILDQLEAKVSAYKLKHDGDLPEQLGALNSRLSSLQIELQGNQDALGRAQQNKLVLEGTLSITETEINRVNTLPARSSGKTDTSQMKSLPGETNLEYLQSQYDDFSKRYLPTYPRMVELKREIEREKVVEHEQRARLDTLKSQIALADREIQQRTKEREGVIKAVAALQSRIEQLPVREQEMAELTRDYEESKSNYKSLLDKKLAATMATDMEHRQEGERFTLLDPPRVPEKPISPRTRQLGLGCIVSLVLGLALPIAAETKKNALLGEWELPEGVPVLGRVPYIEPPRRTRRVAGDQGNTEKRDKRASWKWVLVSSLVLSFVATCAAGVYFYWGKL